MLCRKRVWRPRHLGSRIEKRIEIVQYQLYPRAIMAVVSAQRRTQQSCLVSSYLQLYSFAPGSGANFDNLARKLHAYCLG